MVSSAATIDGKPGVRTIVRMDLASLGPTACDDLLRLLRGVGEAVYGDDGTVVSMVVDLAEAMRCLHCVPALFGDDAIPVALSLDLTATTEAQGAAIAARETAFPSDGRRDRIARLAGPSPEVARCLGRIRQALEA